MTDDLLSGFVFTMLATAFVIALAYASLKLLKRFQTGRAERGEGQDETIAFVRSLPLGTRERVTVVRYRGETLMLGVTAGGISLLARWPDGPPHRSPPPA